MKKALTLFLVATVVAVAGFADPIGLTAKIDGFNFGNVAGDNYEFSGKGGEAKITPGLDFSKTFGAFKLGAGIQDEIQLGDSMGQDLRLHVKGTYALQLSDASKLSFSVYDKLHLKATANVADSAFADADAGNIEDWIGPGVRFDQTLGFGTIYAVVEFNININLKDGSEIEIKTGDDDHIKIGVENTSFGLYGYLQPRLTLVDNSGNTPDDVLTRFDVRVGYKITPSLDARATFKIPTVTDGFKKPGLAIQPRITYSNIIPGLNAYADFEITGIGAEDPVKIGFIPAVGVTFAF